MKRGREFYIIEVETASGSMLDTENLYQSEEAARKSAEDVRRVNYGLSATIYRLKCMGEVREAKAVKGKP